MGVPDWSFTRHEASAARERGLLIFAWRNCGYATTARAALDEIGVPYSDVTIGKMSPLHAELALLTARTTVPYIYERGRLLGGYNADSGYPGLAGSLDRLRRADLLESS